MLAQQRKQGENYWDSWYSYLHSIILCFLVSDMTHMTRFFSTQEQESKTFKCFESCFFVTSFSKERRTSSRPIPSASLINSSYFFFSDRSQLGPVLSYHLCKMHLAKVAAKRETKPIQIPKSWYIFEVFSHQLYSQLCGSCHIFMSTTLRFNLKAKRISPLTEVKSPTMTPWEPRNLKTTTPLVSLWQSHYKTKLFLGNSRSGKKMNKVRSCWKKDNIARQEVSESHLPWIVSVPRLYKSRNQRCEHPFLAAFQRQLYWMVSEVFVKIMNIAAFARVMLFYCIWLSRPWNLLVTAPATS